MIVTDTLATRALVDVRRAFMPGMADFMLRELTRVLIENAEDMACFVGEGSTYLHRGEIIAGSATVPFIVYWCPDPTLGVEFQGGQNDGKVMALPRGFDGRPPERYRLPPELIHPTAADFCDHPLEVRPLHIGEYERIGIDSVRDRWVYREASMRRG